MSNEQANTKQAGTEFGLTTTSNRQIGELIREANNLTADQVEQVLAYQKSHNVKFGEAAVALGFVQREHVIWALSQQFDYSYANAEDVSSKLVVASKPFSEYAEEFRELRAHLLNGNYGKASPRRALAVVSAQPGDGKTYFAANLAVAFSQLGGRTLLVDADMRTPTVHTLFGIQAGVGLSGLLAGRSDVQVINPLSSIPSLFVLPVGVLPPNPAELVQRPVFGVVLQDLLHKFDHVIVDTPAASHGPDARVVAAACGHALLIGREGRSQLSDMKTLTDHMRRAGVSVEGAVTNTYSG